MDLNKQTKEDLIDHIRQQGREIADLNSGIERCGQAEKHTELCLQRALGYIDCINEDKDNITKLDKFYPNEICNIDYRGPKINEIEVTKAY